MTHLIFLLLLGSSSLFAYSERMGQTELRGRGDTGAGQVENEGTEFFANPAASASLHNYVVGMDYTFGKQNGLVASAVDAKSGALKAGFAFTTIEDQELAMNLAYPLFQSLAIGATGYRTIGSKHQNADLGILSYINEFFSLGGVAKNLYTDGKDGLERSYRGGIQLTYPNIGRLLFDNDFKKDPERTLGAEFFFGDTFVLRGGYSLTKQMDWSGGFTWKAPKVHMGYSAISSNHELAHWTKLSLVI